MSETPTRITQRVALLGEDNRAVLADRLGFSAERIRELSESGVLVEDAAIAERRQSH